jgi:hypothetical protein
MQKFIAKFEDKIQGVISGADRLVFRGSLRSIQYPEGMMGYLWHKQVPLTAFGKLAHQITSQIKDASLQAAKRQHRPIIYLPSSKTDKKALAEQIAAQDEIRNGLICVLSSVEPCLSFDVGPNPDKKQIELKYRLRKCLFFYHYWVHPEFGFMSGRIQSWFPFQTHIYLNGREWLAQQMKREGLSYVRHENCFPWVEDFARAQALMDDQLKTDWPQQLKGIAQQLNPIHNEMFAGFPCAEYYWSVAESELATDVVFKGDIELRRLFPVLVEHAMTNFSSADVLKFLGHKVTAKGEVHGNFQGEVCTDLKRRALGVRVKHRVEQNAVKMYDKAHHLAGSLLRVEMTMNNPRPFRVYRTTEGNPEGEKKWRPLRRGLADLHRRAAISQKVNERYLDALASVDESTRLHEILAPVEKRIHWQGLPVRPLHPFSAQDTQLLETIARGEFLIEGLCNKDLRRALFPQTSIDAVEAKRRSAQVSRRLRMLRAHGIIRKVRGRSLYQVTAAGRLFLNAFLVARQATANQLMKKAA